MSPTTEAFGTITPPCNSYKIGLDDQPTVKAISKNGVAKWTVQNSDIAKNHYRLFVNDGAKDYALKAEEGTSISALEGSPASSDSHVWRILRAPGGYYCIQDICTHMAWKLNGTAIELATLPDTKESKDWLEPFKFAFTFSG